MRSRTRALLVAFLAPLLVVAAGCGGGDGGGGGKAAVTDENRPYVEALTKSMKDSPEDEDDLELSDDQVDCIAPRFVNVIGVKRLKANDVTPADFADDDSLDFSDLGIGEKEGNALYDTLGECDVNLKELMMDSIAEDEEMNPAMVTCMDEAFTEDNLRLLIVSSMIKGEDAMEDDPKLGPLMGQLMGCAFMGMGDEG